MAISHKDHNHPNTPAARAACRKAIAGGGGDPRVTRIESDGSSARMTVVPRRRGDGGVVKATKAADPRNVKRPGTHLRNIGDLPDVPAMLAYCARLAWAEGWEVTTGHKFNEDEATILIHGPKAEITAIWRVSQPNGIWALHLRRPRMPKGCGKANSAVEAIEMAAGRMPLPDEV